jgi:hypothetical protein
VLQETYFWLHEHTHAEASRPWPEKHSPALQLIELLQSFGLVDVHVITTNIENITSTLSSVLAFSQWPGVESLTFRVAVGRRYSRLLDIQTETDVFPKWFSFGAEELADTVREIHEDEQAGAPPTPSTNLQKWCYATHVLHKNK